MRLRLFSIITTIGCNKVRAVDEKEAGTPTKSLLRRSSVSEIEVSKFTIHFSEQSHWHLRCINGKNIMNIIWELTERKFTWNNLLRFFLREYLSFFLLTWVSEWGIETRPLLVHHSAHHQLLLLRQKSVSMIITSSSNQCNTDIFRQSIRRDIFVSKYSILWGSNASHLSI